VLLWLQELLETQLGDQLELTVKKYTYNEMIIMRHEVNKLMFICAMFDAVI